MYGKHIIVPRDGICASQAPDILETYEVHQCLAFALYDPNLKIGGLAHLVHEDSTAFKLNAANVVDQLLKEMKNNGPLSNDIIAKMCGETHTSHEKSSMVKDKLSSYGIKLSGEDRGGLDQRNVIFYLDGGDLHVFYINSQNEPKII